jgi:hypothetical protein
MLDALHARRDEIRLVSPRHEQTAGHMADAYFRVKHRPAATLTSCGPGSANLTMAIANAFADSSAIFAISANVPTQQFNRGPFQEMYRHKEADFPSVLRPLVKRVYQPTRVEMLPLALRQAHDVMLGGRPGPVLVDVPFNLFVETTDVALETAQQRRTRRRGGAAPEDVAEALDLLQAAERPVLFIGHGVTLAEAGAELTELAERLAIPVISSPNGMGCLPMDHDLSGASCARRWTRRPGAAASHRRARPGARPSPAGARSGATIPPPISRSPPRPCGRRRWSQAPARCCPTMPSSPSIPVSTTTGSCSSGRPASRRPCSMPGASPAWASASAACSAPSWRRPTGLASPSAATAASP